MPRHRQAFAHGAPRAGVAFTACDTRRGRAQPRLCHCAATFPVTDYLATLRVLGTRAGTGSRVEWSARFTPRGVNDRTHPSCFTPSPREAGRRWPPNSHPLRQSPGRSVSGLGSHPDCRPSARRAQRRCSVRRQGEWLGIPRMRRRGPARIVASQGFAPGNPGRVDHPQTEQFARRSPRVGLHEATAPTSRR